MFEPFWADFCEQSQIVQLSTFDQCEVFLSKYNILMTNGNSVWERVKNALSCTLLYLVVKILKMG